MNNYKEFDYLTIAENYFYSFYQSINEFNYIPDPQLPRHSSLISGSLQLPGIPVDKERQTLSLPIFFVPYLHVCHLCSVVTYKENIAVHVLQS